MKLITKELLLEEIAKNYPFEPTEEQNRAITMISEFASCDKDRSMFLLKGYAGTGKTTLIGALVRALKRFSYRVILMAPTGRSAKIFSLYSSTNAYTIHKKIYRQKSILESDNFQLDRNIYEDTLFLIDEASMISNEGLSGSMFGTGRLLDDLISYVYSGKSCRMILLGDSAQLPPIGEIESPALNADILSSYGLSVTEFNLKNVMRQMNRSGILYNATALRQLIQAAEEGKDVGTYSFKFVLKDFPDVKQISGSELVESLNKCYSSDGIGETMVLCRSNKRAIVYNNGIRNAILDREDELNSGDYLMIVKNNYFWTERVLKESNAESAQHVPSFIANGDIALVKRVIKRHELYGFSFCDVTIVFPDYEDFEIDVTVLLDTLHSEAPALKSEDSDRLFYNVMEDYDDITSKKEKMEKLRENSYFNALQVKYAYAVTCHKSQGGQWSNIFIDQGYLPDDKQDLGYCRWLYTALTRAKKTVYLVNWPEDRITK